MITEATPMTMPSSVRMVRILLAHNDWSASFKASVKSGAGGTDSQDWAEMLLRMFLRWGERHRMAVEFIEESAGEEAGIKSATIRVEGRRALAGSSRSAVSTGWSSSAP